MPKAIIKQWYGSFPAAWALGSLPWYWALAIGAALAAPDAFALDATARHAAVRMVEATPALSADPTGRPPRMDFSDRGGTAEAASESGAPR